MKCAKCGLDLPPGVNFCPKCGTAADVERPAEKPRAKTKPFVYGAIILAAIGIIALMVAVIAGRGQKNVTSAPPGAGPPDKSIVAAPPGSPNDGRILSAPPGSPAPGDVTPPAAVKPKPPKTVVDYLAFVKKVEDHRRMMLKDNSQALELAVQGVLGLMLNAAENPSQDPWTPVANELNRQQQNWLSTLEFFDSKPAPAECRKFSGAYREALSTQAGATAQVAASVGSINPAKSSDSSAHMAPLKGMLGTAQDPINEAVDKANGELDAVVANYDMKKPFDVLRESGAKSIIGF